jgi:hypothetical protein
MNYPSVDNPRLLLQTEPFWMVFFYAKMKGLEK